MTMSVALQDLTPLLPYIQSREAWLTDGPLIERYAPPRGPGVAERCAWSRGVTDDQVNTARAFRADFTAQLADLLGADGVLLMPTMFTMPDMPPCPAARTPVWRTTATVPSACCAFLATPVCPSSACPWPPKTARRWACRYWGRREAMRRCWRWQRGWRLLLSENYYFIF